VVISADPLQIRGVQRRERDRDRVSVDLVALTTRRCRERPHQRGLPTRHVEHDLITGDQALREVLPDPGRALNGPLPATPGTGEAHQLLEPGRGVLELLTRQHHRRGVDDLNNIEPLVRINRDRDQPRTSCHRALPVSNG
jgi:hypothetical protein